MLVWIQCASTHVCVVKERRQVITCTLSSEDIQESRYFSFNDDMIYAPGGSCSIKLSISCTLGTGFATNSSSTWPCCSSCGTWPCWSFSVVCMCCEFVQIWINTRKSYVEINAIIIAHLHILDKAQQHKTAVEKFCYFNHCFCHRVACSTMAGCHHHS